MHKTIARTLAATTLLALSPLALAHPGHGALGLLDGLAHPLGADHLLAMVAVGLWAAAALPAGRRLAAPAAFMASLLAGAAAGAAGLSLALVEPAIAASVLLLATMLALPGRIASGPGLLLVALAGSLHGLAHGAELPAGASFAAYAAGFLGSTALLHGLGLMAGQALLAWQRSAARLLAWRLTAASLALAGLALLART